MSSVANCWHEMGTHSRPHLHITGSTHPGDVGSRVPYRGPLDVLREEIAYRKDADGCKSSTGCQ